MTSFQFPDNPKKDKEKRFGLSSFKKSRFRPLIEHALLFPPCLPKVMLLEANSPAQDFVIAQRACGLPSYQTFEARAGHF